MKKILIFLMSAAVAVSCSDDIFDVDPSGKVSSETRDEVAKEDPDKVLQGIEASISPTMPPITRTTFSG